MSKIIASKSNYSQPLQKLLNSIRFPTSSYLPSSWNIPHLFSAMFSKLDENPGLWFHNTLRRTKRQKAWLKRMAPQLKCIKWSNLKDECLMMSQVGTTFHVSFPSIFCNVYDGKTSQGQHDVWYLGRSIQTYFIHFSYCKVILWCHVSVAPLRFLKASSILNIAFIDKCVLPLPLQLRQN